MAFGPTEQTAKPAGVSAAAAAQLPAEATVQRIADGIFWVRMPLPFALDHINLWVLEDGDGWTLVDTGIADDRTRGLWERLFAGPLAGRPVKRVICTHFHPDHVGLASWLCRRFDAPLVMTLTEWCFGRMLGLEGGADYAAGILEHNRRAGHTPERLERIRGRGNVYRKRIEPVPLAFTRIMDGDRLRIGGRDWQVLTFGGHAYEHACLWCPETGVLISGDQILPKISPVVAVWSQQPDAQPLALFLAALQRLATLPADTLVLPSHGRPFATLRQRCEELASHHDQRLATILAACAGPSSVAGVLGRVFQRELDDHQVDFATGEILAHLNHLTATGVARRDTDGDGVWRFSAVS